MCPPSASTDSRPPLELEGAGRSYPFGADALSVGRGSDNRVVVPDEQVSLHHCVLWRTKTDCYVRDDGSADGTFLNDRRVTGTAEVREGDVLRIGRQVFTIRASRDLPSPAPLVPPGFGAPAAPPAAPQGGARPGGGVRAGAFITLFGVAAGLLIFLIPGIGDPGRAAAPAPSPTAGRTLPPTVAGTSSPLALQDYRPALLTTVRLTVPVDDSSGFIGGSGVLVSSQGHILTNFHVIGTPEAGTLYNSKGQIFIAVNTTSMDRAPEILYMAEMVKGDPIMDLALLKIVSRRNGAALPNGFSLPWMTVGDSDALQFGDDLTIVGFPGLGDESVTLTRGTVSGFLAEGGVTRAWIKTDTEISEGNSGGPAVNVRGELVGISSRIRVVSDSGKLGYVRPITLAKPLLALIAP